MEISDILAQTGGLQSMARELGISEADAATGAAALAPAILGGIKKQAQSQPEGLAGLGGLLGQLGGGGLLDNVLGSQPTDVSQGNNVLSQIFGSKDVSHTVAESAATQTGLDPSLLKKMLPMVAMIVAGYLAKQSGGAAASGGGLGGALGGMLGGILGGGGGGATAPSGGLGGSLGGIASMLDMNHDGNALDDIMRMAGKLRG